MGLAAGWQRDIADRGIKLPLTMGHENVGEVAALGPDAKGVKIGDVRLVNPWMGCGECKVCQRGDENLCLKPQNVGVFSQGGYATHMLVPSHRHLFDIGNLSPTDAAPLACSGVTAFSALKKIPTLQDEAVVIIGAGGVGLMGVTLAKKMGAKDIVIVDIDPIASRRKQEQRRRRRGRGRCRRRSIQKEPAAAIGRGRFSRPARPSSPWQLIKAALSWGRAYGGDITVPTPYLPLSAMTCALIGEPGRLAERRSRERTGCRRSRSRRGRSSVNETLNVYAPAR